jgi:hypothetical protein
VAIGDRVATCFEALAAERTRRTAPDGELTFRRAAIYRDLSAPEEPHVENCEHQYNANIHRQSFPDSVSEEHEIYTDYEGCHRHRVKHDSYLSAHSSGKRHFDFSIT